MRLADIICRIGSVCDQFYQNIKQLKKHRNQEHNRSSVSFSSIITNMKLMMVMIIIVFSVYTGIATAAFLLSSSTTFISSTTTMTPAYAQSTNPLPQTIKIRDLVLDLGNGVKTNAQLTYPAINGNGKYPGVLLITGSGAEDMNESADFIHIDGKTGEKI